MSEKEYARRLSLEVTIDGHDVSGPFGPYLTDFSYTDNANGKADEVQISLHDRDGLFTGEWMVQKGMPVEVQIFCEHWEEADDELELPCGSFKIDEVDYSGPPDKIAIKAVSADLTGPIRDTKKTRAWENMSLEGVAQQISQEYGLNLYYSGPNHQFERADQRNEGDIAFLNRLCGERSMNCKVHSGHLVLFDVDEAEGAEASLEIYKMGSMYSPSSYSFKMASSGTDYSDAEVAYTDPKTGTTHKAKVKSKKEGAQDGKKTLTIQKRVENPKQAAALGKSELHNANQKERTGNVEIMGCPYVAAGQVVELVDFGAFSGSWFVKTATHKISGSGGYSTSLELSAPAPTEEESAHDEVSEAAVNYTLSLQASADPNKANTEKAKENFQKFIETLPSSLSDVERLLIKLPDIAGLESSLKNELDKIGWRYLRDMLTWWFAGEASDDAYECMEPFMVDMDWILKYPRAQKVFEDISNNILNEEAKKALTKKLDEMGLLSDKVEYFDFTKAHPTKWKDFSHQFRVVDRDSLPNLNDGLMAALGGFIIYGLAKGWVEPLADGGHRIHITETYAFAHDLFKFDKDNQSLGWWNEENETYEGINSYDNQQLRNSDFLNFRENYGHGQDFQVVSEPKKIENFKGGYYDIPQ